MSYYVASETPPEPRTPPKRNRFQIGTPGVVWYRDRLILRLIAQIIFVILFVGGIFLAVNSLVTNLGNSNIVIDFNVYRRPFGPAITEGPATDTEWTWFREPNLTGSDNWYWGFEGSGTWYTFMAVWIFISLNYAYERLREKPPQAALFLGGSLILLLILPALFRVLVEEFGPSIEPYFSPRANARTLFTGLVNTLKVVLVSIIASTILGILSGVGLLSRNFLVRNVSMVYVEIFRNTPLLLQLLFVYTVLIQALPQARNSITSPDQIGPFKFHEKFYLFNASSFTFPTLNNTDTSWIFFTLTVIGVVIAGYVRRWRLWQQDQTGIPAQTWRIITPIILGFSLLGWLLAGGYPLNGGPFDVDYPQATRFNVEGGLSLSIAFVALTLGLTLYTAAFIADIVRAGIQAVPYGQVEAARAHGLSNNQVLNLVVLPQALRLIIPPLGNQYVNLGKNSSLATAVAYIDLYRVANLANNESGQAVPFFFGLMLIYLGLSLTLSLMTNLLNSATQIRTR